MESTLYRIFTLVGFVSEISDTSPTRVKIPYARAFHEVISMYCTTHWRKQHGNFWLVSRKDHCLERVLRKYFWIKKSINIEYFMASACVRCLHTSCGVSEAKRTSEISDTKQRVCKHRTKHFPCGIMFVTYILRLNTLLKLWQALFKQMWSNNNHWKKAAS